MRLSKAALERLRKLMAGLRPTPPAVSIWDVLAGAAEEERLPQEWRDDLEAFLARCPEEPEDLDPFAEMIEEAGKPASPEVN